VEAYRDYGGQVLRTESAEAHFESVDPSYRRIQLWLIRRMEFFLSCGLEIALCLLEEGVLEEFDLLLRAVGFCYRPISRCG
jgi:hypothetical protein